MDRIELSESIIVEAPFAQATDVVAEATGVRVDAEVARRVTEGVGTLKDFGLLGSSVERIRERRRAEG